MDELLTAVNNLAKQLKETETNLSKKIDGINETLGQFKEDIEGLKITQTLQEKRLDSIEKNLRMRNLIFFGIKESEKSYTDLENMIIKIINNDMGVDCERNEIQHLRRMGRRIEGKVRPVNIGLVTQRKKYLIMKNKDKLKETEIYVKEDYPPKVLEERKKLQEDLKREIANGKNAVIKHNKIIILPEINATSCESTMNQTPSTSKKRSYEPSPTEKNANNIVNNQANKKNKIMKEKQNIIQYLTVHDPHEQGKYTQNNSQNKENEENI